MLCVRRVTITRSGERDGIGEPRDRKRTGEPDVSLETDPGVKDLANQKPEDPENFPEDEPMYRDVLVV